MGCRDGNLRRRWTARARSPEVRHHDRVELRPPSGSFGSSPAPPASGRSIWAPDADTVPLGGSDRRILERAGRRCVPAPAGSSGTLERLRHASAVSCSTSSSRPPRPPTRPWPDGHTASGTAPRTVMWSSSRSRKGDRRQHLSMLAADLASARNGLSTSRDGAAVLVLPSDDASDLAHRLARSMTAKLRGPVTVGAAGPISDPVELPSAFAEAAACKNALVALGRSGQAATPAELGFVGLLLGDHSTAADFVARTVGPLLDARRTTRHRPRADAGHLLRGRPECGQECA